MTSTTIRARRDHEPLLVLLFATTAAFFVLLRIASIDGLEVVVVTARTWILLAISSREFEVRRCELAG
jgi:hypothetical protein